MDSGMNHIESMYLNYSGLLEEFSEDVIRSRYAFLYKECMEFLKSQNLESEVRLDEVLLMHAVLDYFSDVSRLKKFHHIHHINETKVIAYETFWLLRRKPLQVVTQRQDDFLAFINEKFVFSRLAAFLVGNRKDQVLREQDKKAFMNYLDTLYYFLKYRQYDPKMLELMLLAFAQGRSGDGSETAAAGNSCGRKRRDFFETELQKNISGGTCLSVHLCVLADV